MIRRSFLLIATAALSIAATAAQPAMAREQWSKEQANTWYDKQPWLVGANYTPGSAVNELEMWHEPTFDPATVAKELGRSEEHTSEIKSLMRISYAVFCLKKKTTI